MRRTPGTPADQLALLRGIDETSLPHLVADILHFCRNHRDVAVVDSPGDGRRGISSKAPDGANHQTPCRFHLDVTGAVGCAATISRSRGVGEGNGHHEPPGPSRGCVPGLAGVVCREPGTNICRQARVPASGLGLTVQHVHVALCVTHGANVGEKVTRKAPLHIARNSSVALGAWLQLPRAV